MGPTQTDSGTTDAPNDSQTGTLSTAVSDGPSAIGDFEKLVVTVEEIWVHPKQTHETGGEATDTESDDADSESAPESPSETTAKTQAAQDAQVSTNATTANETATTAADTPPAESGAGNESDDGGKPDDEDSGVETGESGVVKIPVDDQAVDLVKLQGDAQTVVSEVELPTGTYTQLKLWVGDTVDAVLKNGDQAEVVTPGNAPLKFNKQFDIRADTKTTFVADFAPHKRGPNGYIIKPVASEVSVSYHTITEPSSSENESVTGNESLPKNDSSSGNES